MKYLILLIVMLLCGGAGWMAGSASGKEAKLALADAKKLGEVANTAREQLQAELNRKIQTLGSEHDAKLRELQSRFDGETGQWQALLAARDGKIDALNQLARGARAQAATLSQRLPAATDPKEREALQRQIAQLQAQAGRAEVEVVGTECSKQKVPADMLASLRGEPS